MTQIDPNTPHRPTPEVHVTDNRGSNSTAWVVAALVAVVAIIAVAFMVTSNQNDATDPDAIAAAADQGRAEGMLSGAQSSLESAQAAAASAANSTAAQASQAAADARSAADSAARSADDAASRASAPPADTLPDTMGEPRPAPQ
ncbi:MAG: hypothetical protein Q7J28_04755 [Caulobacter sp.]|nr:hypothetical protein [Caulobacter sp.]